jgi:O-antigen/teichoic acid export membrane protein
VRSKNAILNFIASFFRNGTGLLLGVLATPVILRYLGEEQYAIFRILLDWFSHLSLLEFGLYGAVLSFLTKILTEKKDKLGVFLQLVLKKYTRILFVQAGCLFVFALFFKFLIPVDPKYSQSAFIAFIIMSSSTLLIYSQIFKAYLEAAQKGYLVSYIMVAHNVMYVVMAVAFVYLSYGVVGQVVAYVISLLFMTLIYMYLCKDMLPLFFSKEILVQDDINLFSKQRKNIFLNELFGRASFMSDNIIITYFLGAKAVTAFYLTQRLAQILQQQLQNVSNSAWPALGELYYKNQREILASRIIQLTELTAAFAGISLGTLILMNQSFMYLWTGKETYSGDLTTYLACINAGFFALISLWAWCLSAINRSDKAVPIFFTQTLVNVIGSFVFTFFIGLNGPLIGTFIGFFFVTIWWLGKIISEIFSIKYRALMLLWVIPFLFPICIAIGIHQFLQWHLSAGWIDFFIKYLVVSFVFAGLVYIFFISRKTKDLFIEKIKEFIMRRK